jgi:hypothetical protein
MSWQRRSSRKGRKAIPAAQRKIHRARITSQAISELINPKTAPTSITRRNPETKHSFTACLMAARVSSFVFEGISMAASLVRWVSKDLRISFGTAA